jgi:hypothetical protein
VKGNSELDVYLGHLQHKRSFLSKALEHERNAVPKRTATLNALIIADQHWQNAIEFIRSGKPSQRPTLTELLDRRLLLNYLLKLGRELESQRARYLVQAKIVEPNAANAARGRIENFLHDLREVIQFVSKQN